MKIPLLSKLFEKRSTLAQPERWLVEALSGSKAISGTAVNPSTALNSTAVYACVRVLAESVASLPLLLYQRLPSGGKERAQHHRLYTLLHDLVNPEMTSFEFRETLMGHLLLWGNAYAEIERDKAGREVALWPLRPDRMLLRYDNDKLVYQYTLPNGQQVVLRQEQLLHIKGLSPDGLVGYSPIKLTREAIGLALATEEFGSRFFGNGARPGAVLEHPNKLSDDAQERLRASVTELYSGLSKAHRVMVLEEGMKWHQTGIPPEDAQFLQTRSFQLNEICRIYRVPPHLVGDLSKATFSNIEHQSIDFVVHTIRPWLVRWEQAVRRDLLSPADRSKYFAEFLVDGLLRGDIKSRYEAYAVGRQNGWLSADDIRSLENMNPLPDGQGKTYLVPLNMKPADQLDEQDEQPAPEKRHLRGDNKKQGSDLRRRLMQGYRAIWHDGLIRVVKREEADIMRQAKKQLAQRSQEQFTAWLSDFYREHEEYVERIFEPIMESYQALLNTAVADEVGTDERAADISDFRRECLSGIIKRHCATSFKELRNTMLNAQIEGKDYLAALEGTFAEWQAERLLAQARDEAQRAGNALTMKLFMVYGIRKIRWSPKGSSCPMCRELSGKVVDVDTPFAVRGSKKHPPLHKGCDCGIEAEQTERGSTAGKDQVVPDEIKPKSASTPRYNKSNAVVDYVVGDALVDKRVFYDAEGKMIKQIHTNDHGRPKRHPFGLFGEHVHEHIWRGEVIVNRVIRELVDDERRKNADILPKTRRR